MKIAKWTLDGIRVPQEGSVHRYRIKKRALELLQQIGIPNIPIARTVNVKVRVNNPLAKFTENHDKAKWVHELLVEAKIIKDTTISTIRNSQQEGRYEINCPSIVITIFIEEDHKNNEGLDVETLPLICL